MRRYLVAIATVAALVIGVLSPVPSLAGPIATPGKSVGNGPCLTSGKANSQLQSTKNTNKACVAAPSFTLSNSSEIRTVNTVATGFTITSTGGQIASFTISPSTPSGMSFNPTTGAFFGTPTEVAAATDYTITATNSAGSASKIFTFTVIEVIYNIGDIGPGGGKIFYVDSVGFNCGSDFSATGSPTLGKCHYLEVAPNDWYRSLPPQGCYNISEDPGIPWAIDEYLNISIPGAREVAIGGGYKNSTQIVSTIGRSFECFAAGLARSYQNTLGLEWYLPSIEELQALQQNQIAVGLTSFSFWSSTENDASTAKDLGNFNAPGNGSKATTTTKIRPIRAF